MAHGEHWEAVSADVETLVERLIPIVLQRGKPTGPVPFQSRDAHGNRIEENAYGLEYPPDSPLRYLGLVVTQTHRGEENKAFWTAYPVCHEGVPARLQVDGVLPFETPIQGRVEATSPEGSAVTFFDPYFFLNRDRYEVGDEYDFSVAGLAYQLRRAERSTIAVDKGPIIDIEREERLKRDPSADVSQITKVELSMEGASILIQSDVDEDYSFRSQVQAIQRVTAADVGFWRILVSLANIFGRPLSCYIYASDAVLGQYVPQVGDDVEGLVWLQAYLV